MKIKRGDTVKLLVGKDAGRSGRVLSILAKQNSVVVDGLNLFKKHMKGDNKLKKSAIIDIAKSVHVSNVMIVCPACSKASRVALKIVDGVKIRVCKKCGKSVESKKEAEVATKVVKTKEVIKKEIHAEVNKKGMK